MNYDKEGAGVSKTEDRRPGFVRFFYVIGHRFWQIVVLNALYIFACLPIVTIGPATAGMTYVLRNYSQEKHADMFSDFVDKCKEHFKKGVFATVLTAVVGVLAWLAFNFYTTAQMGATMRVLALIVVIYIFYMLLSVNLYLYPMMVSFDLPFKKVLKNSWILATYKPLRNVAMLLFNALIFGLCVWFFPVSLPVLLFLAFTICNLFNNFMIYPLLVKYVATPAEEKPVSDEEILFKDRT
ncbi:MAG: DUF624 domain-containing protein [Clostridia bacterium]|nr:DUF624 domain-containing protein [Clostridia bacterium]